MFYSLYAMSASVEYKISASSSKFLSE